MNYTFSDNKVIQKFINRAPKHILGGMNASETRKYVMFRMRGYDPATAKRNAVVLERFEWLSYQGKVRMYATPQEEDYIVATYGKSGPDGYIGKNGKRVSKKAAREELEEIISRLGVWWVTSQIWNEKTQSWEVVEGIGFCCGYDNPLSPFENCYVPDLMRTAIIEAESRHWQMDKEDRSNAG